MTVYGIYHRYQVPQYIENDTIDSIVSQLRFIIDEGLGYADCIITDAGDVHIVDAHLNSNVSIDDVKQVAKRLDLPVDVEKLKLAEPITID